MNNKFRIILGFFILALLLFALLAFCSIYYGWKNVLTAFAIALVITLLLFVAMWLLMGGE